MMILKKTNNSQPHKNKFRTYLFKISDIVFLPLTFISAILLKYYRAYSLKKFPYTKKILLFIGVFPIRDHYYDPIFNPNRLRYSLRLNRNLPGIDFNDKEQLEILEKFNCNDELLKLPLEKEMPLEFYYNNDTFKSGDAEYLYNMLRLYRPKRIIEIGCGNSTLLINKAINKNKDDLKDYTCEHICIEPYEQGWLEQIGVYVIREKVETIDMNIFKSLKANDVLFIDSSHIIRSQGDVLLEYLEILPSLNKGVLIHIHDIFTPKDYLDEWFGEYFWNEQYLLEAFLCFNKYFRIIGATNYLSHKYKSQFSEKCPVYKIQTGREPGSFWLIKS